jgi:cathepsin A (carboxypeptidase C)
MSPVFASLITHMYVQHILPGQCRMLPYNGDADLMCSFLEAAFFVDALAKIMSGVETVERQTWLYSLDESGNVSAVAGFRQAYNFSGERVQLDLMTVKGSGHFVPTDRSGPALQMIANFLSGSGNYNATVPFSLERQPLKPQYQVVSL